MASDDMALCTCYEQDRLVAHKPDPVHEHDMMDLVADRKDGPQSPKPRRLVSERPRRDLEFRLREFAQKPGDEYLEPFRSRVDLPDR